MAGVTPGLARQVDHLRSQGAACRELGSAFYGTLVEHLADDAAAGGTTAALLAGHEADPGPSALALRLLAAVHSLVLEGRLPEVARHYPSTGGDGDADAAWERLRVSLPEHTDEIRAGLASAPQTNEVGRSAALFGALLTVAADSPGLPVRLFEIGSSAGLNLLADHFAYRAADGSHWLPTPSRPEELDGPSRPEVRAPASLEGPRMTPSELLDNDPPVLLDPAWSAMPPAPERLEIIERVGCDLAPVDARTDEGALRLLSCVWPDQTARLARLRGALAVAADHPVEVRRQAACDFVDSIELTDGHHTVVQHSVMWQYMPTDEQQRVLARLEELGASAGPERRLTHLAFEPQRLEPGEPHRFMVAATTWPGGQERILGEAPPHGVPVTWQEDA